MCYVDCRSVDASAPDVFARGLKQGALPVFLQSLPAQVIATIEEILRTSGVKDVAKALKSCTQKTQNGSAPSFARGALLDAMLATAPAIAAPIQRMCDTFDLIVSAWTTARIQGKLGPTEQQYPVLVIDEFNMLMLWSDSSPNELQNFLNYLVKVSKQDRTCHVVLATSDFGAMSWLNDRESPLLLFRLL
jgi:hypothetical protein